MLLYTHPAVPGRSSLKPFKGPLIPSILPQISEGEAGLQPQVISYQLAACQANFQCTAAQCTARMGGWRVSPLGCYIHCHTVCSQVHLSINTMQYLDHSVSYGRKKDGSHCRRVTYLSLSLPCRPSQFLAILVSSSARIGGQIRISPPSQSVQ